MGDVVLIVPVIKSFREYYPDIKITLLTREKFHPFFDGIAKLSLPIVHLKKRHKGVLGINKLANELNKSQQFDVVIDLHSVIRSKAICAFMRLKGIPTYSIDKARIEKKEFLKDISKPKLSHVTERYIGVFRKAGFNFELKKHWLTPREGEIDILKHIKPSDLNIGIAPFSVHKSKEWGVDKIHDLIQMVNNDYQVNFFLFGGGEEENIKLEMIANKYENVTNLAEKYSLRDEMNLIRNMKLMITMDSSNMHIASLMGISVISVWGGTHPGIGFSALYQPKENSIQLPFEEQKKCRFTVYGTSDNQRKSFPYFCIQLIEADTVFARVKEIL